MTEHWLFPVVLALMICIAVGAMATLAGFFRRRHGRRLADTVNGIILVLFLGYVGVGVCVAAFMAVTSVVPNQEIEYDAREFLR